MKKIYGDDLVINENSRHVIGKRNIINGSNCFIEGDNCIVNGEDCVVLKGKRTMVNGDYCEAHGHVSIVNGRYCRVIGTVDTINGRKCAVNGVATKRHSSFARSNANCGNIASTTSIDVIGTNNGGCVFHFKHPVQMSDGSVLSATEASAAASGHEPLAPKPSAPTRNTEPSDPYAAIRNLKSEPSSEN